MLDFSNKEFVRSFSYSNFKEDREIVFEERILGRRYLKIGTACATTAVANLFKVYDPSVERFKFVYLVGVARQHPSDINVKYKDGVEIAQENAFVDPVMTIIYDEPISFEQVEYIMEQYVRGLPVQMIKTAKELEYKDFIDNCDFEEIDFEDID